MPEQTTDRRAAIEAALKLFGNKPVAESGIALLGALGYSSEKTADLGTEPATFASSVEQVRPELGPLNRDRVQLAAWKDCGFLFQITSDEVATLALQQPLLLTDSAYSQGQIESFVFLAVELADKQWSRSSLAGIVRELNRRFPMPALVLFKHGEFLTLAVIHRRLHKRDQARDVLDKVTLIKDIAFADPLRAHIEILNDLSLASLHAEYAFHDFVGLHQAWERRLGSYALNERFYREIANWYFWALGAKGVTLPASIESIRDKEEREKQRSIFFIRLLTRLIFCWFLQEKGLIPRDIFRERSAKAMLKDLSPTSGTYYRAVLQNLFFATLNQEQDKRDWRKKYPGSRDGNRGVTNLWRYEGLLKEPLRLEGLLRDQIPFVNGGLFECLDDQFTTPMVFLDGFSERKDNELLLPNDLFFGAEREVDLSGTYDDQRRNHEKVRGLIEILGRYKFTVEENTPLEEEIALDPELLGKVFENLLASYNSDTGTTARKALGAFYTPREIVGYMVDESLRSYLAATVPDVPEAALRSLFSNQRDATTLPDQQRASLVRAIGSVKVLDPACGSGAFPMGVLHRLVDLLQKLDPNNESFKRDRLADAERYRELLQQSNAPRTELDECDARIEDIRRSFDSRVHALDYARKFHLIENCIYGIDIQPIACQIAKLRFFIALIVDQRLTRRAGNLGITPLPNLETKIVAADALIPIERAEQHQFDLLDEQIKPLRRQLEQVRHEHFNARTPAKKKSCRDRDARLRAEIAGLLQDSGMPAESATALASWNPYDQNHAAGFFDSRWMYGWADGFDVVIGNPPYVRIQTLKQQDAARVAFYRRHYQSTQKGNYDLYVVFVEVGMSLLRKQGHLAFILPHKFFNAKYGEPLRQLIAQGRALAHVVHFGEEQVFPGATIYVCLMFLSRSGADSCRFVRPGSLAQWRADFKGVEGSFAAESITASEWNFTVGESASLFERLKKMPLRLEDVTTRIFQGLKTSADKIYIVEERSRTRKIVRVYSAQTESEHELEPDLLHPLIKGGDSKAFALSRTDRLILFPYAPVDSSGTQLIPAKTLKAEYPATWEYLNIHRTYLANREDGAMAGAHWYAFGRSQALDVISLPKLFTPDLAPKAAFSYDGDGSAYFTGGVSGGYGILPKDGWLPHYLLGLLNSRIVDFYHHNVATQMRGGWYSYESRFIKSLPMAPADTRQQAEVSRWVEYLIWLLQPSAQELTARDTLMRGYFEQILNALVYELYLPDLLAGAGLQFFALVSNEKLPVLGSQPTEQRLAELRKVFERLYATSHPIRGALHALRALEAVRMAEGDA